MEDKPLEGLVLSWDPDAMIEGRYIRRERKKTFT
jgi:hypothetical protein